MEDKYSKLHIANLVITSAIAGGLLLHYGSSSFIKDLSLPQPNLTPGVVLETDKDKVCENGYAAKMRNVTTGVKSRVFAEYGIASRKPGEYEVDHLISLELGGSNDIRNLWPQSYKGEWNAHMKDRLENRLHEMVCEGTITLEEAQKAISENWIEAYEKYISN